MSQSTPAYPFSDHFHALLASHHTFPLTHNLHQLVYSPLLMCQEECQIVHIHSAQIFEVGEEKTALVMESWGQNFSRWQLPAIYSKKVSMKSKKNREKRPAGELRCLLLALLHSFSSAPLIMQFSHRSWVVVLSISPLYLLRLRA